MATIPSTTVINDPYVIELIAPGPQGRPGLDGGQRAQNLAIGYADGRVASVHYFADEAHTVPAGHRLLDYGPAGLSRVRHFDASGTLTRVVHLDRDANGKLTGLRETAS